MTLPRPALCLVTDRRRLAGDARTRRAELAALEAFLDDALALAIDLVQIRERDLDAGELAALVRRTVGRASPTGVRVIVNDRVDVALAAGAHGVHLRSDSPPPARVRSILSDRIVGQSVHAHDRVEGRTYADYLLFGPVFPTASKPGAPGVGLEALGRAAAAARPLPVLAIGGITPERTAECLAAGAAGVAAIEVFLPAGRSPGALGMRRAVAELRSAMDERADPAQTGRKP